MSEWFHRAHSDASSEVTSAIAAQQRFAGWHKAALQNSRLRAAKPRRTVADSLKSYDPLS